MDKKRETVLTQITNWLSKYSFYIVVFMSVFHIGLACIHTRESGRVDQVYSHPLCLFPIFP
jgi:hypothetical protein